MLHTLLKLTLVALIVTLCACNTMPKPSSDGQKDLTFKFATLKFATNHGLIDPDAIGVIGAVSNNPGKTTIDGVNEYRRWWCSKHSQREMNNYVQRVSIKHCQEMQGKWDGHWCRSNSDTPLFYVDGGNLNHFKDPYDNHLPRCTSGTTYSVIASTSESSNSDAWQTRANRTYGFKTQQAQAQQKNADEAKRFRI